MNTEKLISELSSYKKTKSLTNSQIETDLGLPKNSLSNFLSLKKALPDKWGEPILHYISQSNVVINTLGNLKDKVTTADKIAAPEIKNMEEAYLISDWYVKYQRDNPWIFKIENYCEKEGITTEDLILSHKERNKPQKSKKGTNSLEQEKSAAIEPLSNTNGYSNWRSEYTKKKLGLK